MNKKILITGGAGFIGLHLANRLVNDGHRVHLIDNMSRSVFDLEFKEIFVMMSTLTDKDWKSSGNRGGTHMPLSLWWQNHKDKDDYVFWKGRIANLKTNRKREEGIAQIIFEEVDAHPCH